MCSHLYSPKTSPKCLQKCAYVCAPECVCMQVDGCVRVYVNVSVYVPAVCTKIWAWPEVRGRCWVLLCFIPLRQGLSLNQKTSSLLCLGLLDRELPGFNCFHRSLLSVRSMLSHIQLFCVGAGDLNPGLHACTTTVLSTGLSPQPLPRFLS